MAQARCGDRVRWGLFLALVAVLASPGWPQLTIDSGRPPPTFELGRGLNPVRLRQPRDGDVFLPVNLNNWWGYAAADGDVIVYPRFDWTDEPVDGFFRAVLKGRTGFLRGSGHWQIDPVFHYADRFAEGHAVVGDDQGRFTFIDRAGRPITRRFFEQARRFKDGVAVVQVDGLCGFIDKSGDFAIPPRFASARSFHDGVAAVREAVRPPAVGRMGFIDRRGRFAFVDSSGRLTDLRDFNEGFAAAQVRLDDGRQLWGYLDKRYRLRIAPRFDEARDFVNGMAAVKVGRQWGFIDKRGELVVGPRFDEADDFDGTLAMVRVGELWGFVDKTGAEAVVPQFAFAEPFVGRFARVQAPPNFGYIDVAGRPVWNPAIVFLEGMVDVRPATRAAVANDEDSVGEAAALPPPARKPPPAPYPPEHRYDEGLPLAK